MSIFDDHYVVIALAISYFCPRVAKVLKGHARCEIGSGLTSLRSDSISMLIISDAIPAQLTSKLGWCIVQNMRITLSLDDDVFRLVIGKSSIRTRASRVFAA